MKRSVLALDPAAHARANNESGLGTGTPGGQTPIYPVARRRLLRPPAAANAVLMGAAALIYAVIYRLAAATRHLLMTR